MNLLDRNDLAARYDVDLSTIWRWVEKGKLPEPDWTVGKNHYVWDEATIEEWERGTSSV